MKKIDKDNIIVAAISLLTAFLLFNILLKPQVRQLRAIRAQYVSQEGLVKVRSVQREEILSSRENAEKWEKRAEEIEKQFLKRTEMTSFIKGLNKIADETGAKIESVDPLENRKFEQSGVEETSIVVNVLGEYGRILSFIDKLYNNEKLVKISHVDMAVPDSETDGSTLTASMTITIFVTTG